MSKAVRAAKSGVWHSRERSGGVRVPGRVRSRHAVVLESRNDDVWRQLDPVLWDLTHNPWAILQTASRDRIVASSAFEQGEAVTLSG